MNNKLLGDARRAKSSVEAVLKMGKDAAAFTRKLIVKKKVRLEFDVERRDKFGRLLAYVYLEDGTFVNAEILKQGYGQVMTHPPNLRYEQLFLKLQQEARQAGRGLWNPSTAGS
jgi:micrococcal nuclease